MRVISKKIFYLIKEKGDRQIKIVCLSLFR